MAGSVTGRTGRLTGAAGCGFGGLVSGAVDDELTAGRVGVGGGIVAGRTGVGGLMSDVAGGGLVVAEVAGETVGAAEGAIAAES